MLENILERAREINPALLIIDSIQTVYSQLLDSSPGSVTQVRECAAMLLRYAKETHTPVILVGHITKEGSIAGPKVLEHIVDRGIALKGTTPIPTVCCAALRTGTVLRQNWPFLK